MSDMILMEYSNGSKDAFALCPKCGWIGKHELKLPYSSKNHACELKAPCSCPICSTTYETCTSRGRIGWLISYARFKLNAHEYIESVRANNSQYTRVENKPETSVANPLPSEKKDNPKTQIIEPAPIVEQDSSGMAMSDPTHASKCSTAAGCDIQIACGAGPRSLADVHSVIHDDLAITEHDGSIDEEAYNPTTDPRSGIDLADHRDAYATQRGDSHIRSDLYRRIVHVLDSVENNLAHMEPEYTPEPMPQEIIAEDVFSANESLPPPLDGLERKIEQWKRELLDTGKRNKMINYRETKRATLRILEPEATDLFNRLAFSDRSLTFQKPVSKDSDLRTYSMIALMETLSYNLNVQVGDIKTAGTIIEREKTLKNLRSKAKLAQEEQGTNILYLCFGFIYWRAQNRDSSPWLKAPLLMMPVSLGLKSLNAPYTLSRYDDEIEVNPTLDYLFNTEYHIDLPKFDLKNRESFDEYLSQIEEIVDKRGWKVVREVSLGLLSFLKISMYHDLDHNHERMAGHPVIKALAGDRTALDELPVEAEQFDFDAVKPDEWHEVVDSDSSQEEAILLSKLGVSFVMQGPPGTGKSQTITNIIAEALADGKKVLFVSEKAAALEVVLKRLTEVQLDDFCLSLHNYKANKKDIITSIGANLNLEPEYVNRASINELTELFHDREFLTHYAKDLHRVIEPLGESVYTAYGKYSKLENSSEVAFKFDNPVEVSREQYSSLLYVLDALEKALRNLSGPLNASPWHGTLVKSFGQVFKQKMIDETEGLPDRLRQLDTLIREINSKYGSMLGTSWKELARSIDVYKAALSLPLFPYWWSDSQKQEVLLGRIQREANDCKTLAASMQDIENTFSDAILGAPLEDWSAHAKDILTAYETVGYTKATAGESCLSLALRNASETHGLLADLIAFSEEYLTLAERFGLRKNDSLKNAAAVNAVLDLIPKRPAFHEHVWFTSQNNREAFELLDAAKEHANIIDELTGRLRHSWSDTVRELDLEAIRHTLLEEKAWIYDNLAEDASVVSALTEQTDKARAILMKATKLAEAHAKAVKTLAIASEDSLDGLRFLSSILQLVSSGSSLEAAWFDIRKNEMALPLLSEAREHDRNIEALKEEILKKWEPEALRMGNEATAMLGRFKTEYTGPFHFLKAGYKADMKTVRLLSKGVGRSIDESEVISFLQTLKEIQDEEQWYTQRQDQLRELAGSYYLGADTDWMAVRRGMELAAGIANSFPYGNIPEEVIAAILRSLSSIQSVAEVKELASILSTNNVGEIETLIDSAPFIEGSGADASLKETVIPQTVKFLEECDAKNKIIASLQDVFASDNSITRKDIVDLFELDHLLKHEEKWFAENEEPFARLFVMANQGSRSDFERIGDGLNYAKEMLSLFEDDIPDQLISVLCAEEMPEDIPTAADRLSMEAVEQLAQKLHALAPYLSDESASVSESILPKLSTRHVATESLMALESEIRPVLRDPAISMEQAVSSLPRAVQAQTLRNQLLNQEKDIADQLGERYNGIDTDWAAIEADIIAVRDFLGGFGSTIPARFLETICNNAPLRHEAGAKLDDLKEIQTNAQTALSAFAGYFEETERIGELEFGALADRYDHCLNGFDELNRWLDYVEAEADCDAKGLSSFTEAIEKANNTIPDVRNAFERGFYAQWLAGVISDVPAVESFRRRIHEQRTERFIKLDEKQYIIARKRIRERIIHTFPDPDKMTKAGSELGILTHEMAKKTRIMPLRRLFRSIPNLLLTLKPCFMMSPLSVAYFLDSEAYQFDMVIFDEASQIFPQDAIGAIFRAKQVIIAGDTKQLPPTNFFAATTGSGGEGYDDDEGYDDEVYDSILEETANVLPNRWLLWHYRSKHEHLIAFSNQEIYGNKLITFPSSNESEPDTGVEFVHVPEGYYEPSPKNYNLLEAQRCVQLVKEHIDKHPERSLGIIAFSEKQQQAIALEIQRFREKNPKYENFFAEGKENEFFIKNLENVQGDERDTILFSVGYAKTREQKASGKPMSMRFGPLGVQGGERRLNVAITRAKINVKLVASILPSDIDLSKTESEGIRMLRAYIEFAMNGEATLSAARKVNKPDDFVDVIAQFIRKHGYKVRQYVGCSGYKIDIAVQHSSDSIEQFVAGIECDGFSYASAKTTRDRDRLRSSVLRGMGWNLYRVWSTEWFKNPEVEGQRLLDFIQKAVQDCDAKIKILEEEKRRIEERKRLELEKARAAREAEERRKQREREEEARQRAELEATQRRRRETAERKAAEQKVQQEEARRREAEWKKQNDLSWIDAGAKVYHKNYGTGTITGLSDKSVTVRFGTSEHSFMVPNVFINGILMNASDHEAEAKRRSTAKSRAWAKSGDIVSHKTFGKGKVVKVEGDYVEVRFAQETKTFVYPDSFEHGFLRTE